MLEITAGDDVAIAHTLTVDKATFTIDTGATVKASIVSTNRKKVLIPPVTCLEAAVGADWANSLVIIPFTSAQTILVTGVDIGKVLLEVQVDDSGKSTWFEEILFLKGSIS